MSSLTVLGKNRVGRIKAWWYDIEPGEGVLDWLQLGSKGQWNLNSSWLDYSFENTFYPFVLSGEKIDRHFYDFLNSYLVEKESDGVVRLAGANLNYQKMILKQDCNENPLTYTFPLYLQDEIKRSNKCAFGIIKNASHSGDKFGIMKRVKKEEQ